MMITTYMRNSRSCPRTRESVEAILDAERKEASRIHEDRGLQKRVEELQRKRDVLKEKVDGMQGADDARTAELNKLRGPWEKTLRDALSSLKTKFCDYMETLGARGDVELVEQPTFARWGLAIKVAFRDVVIYDSWMLGSSPVVNEVCFYHHVPHGATSSLAVSCSRGR